VTPGPILFDELVPRFLISSLAREVDGGFVFVLLVVAEELGPVTLVKLAERDRDRLMLLFRVGGGRERLSDLPLDDRLFDRALRAEATDDEEGFRVLLDDLPLKDDVREEVDRALLPLCTGAGFRGDAGGLLFFFSRSSSLPLELDVLHV